MTPDPNIFRNPVDVTRDAADAAATKLQKHFKNIFKWAKPGLFLFIFILFTWKYNTNTINDKSIDGVPFTTLKIEHNNFWPK